MRIVVNDIAASKTGAMTILKGFYEYVVNNDKDNEWIFLLSSHYFEETDNVRIIVREDVKKNWLNKIKFDFFTGKNFINSLNPDVVFSMQNIITFGVKAPQCLYVHQSLPYANVKKFSFLKSDERESAIYQRIVGKFIDLSIKKAKKVIVQTKWMKDAICKKLKIDRNKIVNILPDFEDVSCFKKDEIFDNHKFFYPTSNNVYKNNKCIFEACMILNYERINDYSVVLAMASRPQNLSNKNVKITDFLPRDELMNFYNQSTLIFPSYVETLGLPMIEAKSLGAIVLASDCPFSHEILDHYENAYFFNPFDSRELAELMKKVINKSIVRKDSLYIAKNGNSWKKVLEEVTSIENIIYN